MAVCGTSDRACNLKCQSSPLIARVIMVEIKSRRNAFDAFDRDPMTSVSKRFITRVDVASSRASDRDPTFTT